MTDLNLNRERMRLIRAIDDGKVRTSTGGLLLWQITHSQKKRVESAVRELQEHGYVAPEFVDGRPQLTEAGQAVAA